MSDQDMIKALCLDWSEAHTYCQKVALNLGATDFEVYGDSYGVPGIEDLVDLIVRLGSKPAAHQSRPSS